MKVWGIISCGKGMEKHGPLIAMIIAQFTYAGMSLLSKAAISSGMKASVFVSYRQAIAALVLAPFAFFVERKSSPHLTFYMLGKIFIICTFGMTLSLNLNYYALNFVSATFATAITNTIPALVFIIAVSLRIESLAITQRYGKAKVLGTVLGLSGAMVFTFFKGSILYSGSKNEAHNSTEKSYTKEEWIKGSILLLASNLSWSLWLVMQSPILKQYPAKLRLTNIQCCFSCLVTTIYGAAVERNISSWKLGWNVNLISVVYSGVIVTGITYSLQVWVVQKRGPVYTAIFSPLALVVTAVLSAILLHETLHWGSVLGAVLLVFGLYSFLWGKKQEVQNANKQIIVPSKPEAQLESIITSKSTTNEVK